MSNNHSETGYASGTIKETQFGFDYDVEKLENLGWVDRNGVRLLYNRQDDRLEIRRTKPRMEDLLEELRCLTDEWEADIQPGADRAIQSRNQTLSDCVEQLRTYIHSYES